MSVFVDPSALLAMLDAGDTQHPRARAAWETLLQRDEPLVTTSDVLVETFALVQHRLGMEAGRVLADDVVPVLRVHWVGETEHRLGVTALIAVGRRQLSLVDCGWAGQFRRLRSETLTRRPGAGTLRSAGGAPWLSRAARTSR